MALAVIFAVMNLALYSAIQRLGLGLAVTLEFLGPLTVALLSARGVRELLLAAGAALGVYVLVLPSPSSDLLGIALAVTAAAAWALYIVTNKVAGRRLPGLQAPALGSLLSATAYLPVLVWLGIQGRLWGWPLLLAVAAGLLSSAIPYAADLTALRHIPPKLFGTFSSVQPVCAALAGILILDQWLAGHEWLGIAIIVGTNVIATRKSSSRQLTPGPLAPASNHAPPDQRSRAILETGSGRDTRQATDISPGASTRRKYKVSAVWTCRRRSY